MDLFAGMPTPATKHNKVANKRNMFMLRQQPLAASSAAQPVDLFADLPESASTTDHQTKGNLNKNNDISELKRKLDVPVDEECPAKKPLIDAFALRGMFAERKGERDEMQDKHVIIEDYSRLVPQAHPSVFRLAYYAVFDGHAGSKAAEWASANLHKTLALKFPRGDVSKVESEIKRTLIETYRKADDDFLKVASKSKPSWKDGTTATTVLVVNNTLYIANLGDSKAILCRYNEKEKKYTGVSLTTDHNPSDYAERMRIQKVGGQVREGRVMGVLEVSRSLGDGPYKNHGVSSLPDVKRCQLTNNDSWLLIACDGLWKTFTNDEAATSVNQILNDTKGVDGEISLLKRQELACNKLANDAVRRLSADNVTVVLVTINTHKRSDT